MWVKSLPPICQNERQRPLLRMFVEGAASRPWVVRALHDVTGEHRRKPIKNPQRVKRDFHILHVTPPKCQNSQAPLLAAPRDCRHNATHNWSLNLQSFDFESNNSYNNIFFVFVFSIDVFIEIKFQARSRSGPYLLNTCPKLQIQNPHLTQHVGLNLRTFRWTSLRTESDNGLYLPEEIDGLLDNNTSHPTDLLISQLS